jgi:tetratricopeptide (TPR) repeat protein
MSLENEESDAKRHNAAIAYERLGNIALLRKDTAAAEEYFLQLVSILEPVAETTGMTDNRRELAVGYDRLSGVYESLGDHSKARDCIHKAIDIFERYSDLAGLAGSKSELAYLQYRAASLHE